VASQTFSFETDMEGWTATHGTFVRKTGGGANGTNAHISSSEDLDNQCDVVQSPLFFLTDTSTLDRLRYDIEPQSGGQYWDRANISLVDAQSGDRVVLTPQATSGLPDGRQRDRGTSGRAGWASTPGFRTSGTTRRSTRRRIKAGVPGRVARGRSTTEPARPTRARVSTSTR
jgi:hypothetical protein